MTSLSLSPRINDIRWYVPLLISALITGFLFFIDEGYYSFEWMSKPANWVAFGIYSLPMFFFQGLALVFLPKKLSLSSRYLLAALIGIGLALFILFKFLFQIF